jgi:hypothetical protein
MKNNKNRMFGFRRLSLALAGVGLLSAASGGYTAGANSRFESAAARSTALNTRLEELTAIHGLANAVAESADSGDVVAIEKQAHELTAAWKFFANSPESRKNPLAAALLGLDREIEVFVGLTTAAAHALRNGDAAEAAEVRAAMPQIEAALFSKLNSAQAVLADQADLAAGGRIAAARVAGYGKGVATGGLACFCALAVWGLARKLAVRMHRHAPEGGRAFQGMARARL